MPSDTDGKSRNPNNKLNNRDQLLVWIMGFAFAGYALAGFILVMLCLSVPFPF